MRQGFSRCMDCGEMRSTAWVFALAKALCSGCAAAQLERFHLERLSQNEANQRECITSRLTK